MKESDTSYKRARLRGDLDSAFDAIVIGSGAGGLTAAALMALDGKRVVVLERHAVPGGCLQAFHRNGYEWDVGLHYMGEVHRPGTLSRLFAKVTRDQLKWARMPDVYNRIVIGDEMYDWVAGAEPFKERMKAYFPSEAATIDRYIELVQGVGRASRGFFTTRALPAGVNEAWQAQATEPFLAFARRTVTEVLSELTQNETLMAVLCGDFGDYAELPERASFAAHALVVGHYLDGANYPIGGAPRVAETMADTIRAAGGHVLVAADVTGVLQAGGKVAGVALADGSTLEAATVISAIGIGQTLQLLSDEIANTESLRTGNKDMPRSLPAVALNIGLKASNEELDMHPANIWAHKSARQAEDWRRYVTDPENEVLPVHFISQPSAKDPSWPERYPGRSTIDICSFTSWSLFEPYADSHWQQRGDAYLELKERLTEELLQQVYRFYPQTHGRVDHCELATPLSFNHFLNRSQGDFMSYSPVPARYSENWMRIHGPLQGLYFSGQDVAQGGVSGAMIGGLLAASAAMGRDLFSELRN